MAAPESRSAAKRRLLEKFLQGEAARQCAEAPIDPRALGAAVPLTPDQNLLWLSTQMAGSAPAYNEPITLHYRGPLDRNALERAFQEVVRRHEALRTTFATVEGEILQTVHQELRIQIPYVDLSKLPSDEREREANRIAVSDGARPLDPGVGPLVRARLVTLEPEYHRVFLTLHHLIVDGGSVHRILMPELAAIYQAFAAGESSPLAEPRLQYGDFVLWQKRTVDSAAVVRQTTYWREQLAGELSILQLPSDRPRPAVQSYRGAMHRFAISREMTDALKAASTAEGVTLYMFLLAGFKTLLYRYSGQSDIIVGGVAEARRRVEFERTIGMFLKFPPLRTHPAPDMSFQKYLAHVKDTVLGALANNDVPFDQLIRDLQPQRESAGRPFFQATLSMKPTAVEDADSRWDLTQMDTATGFAKVDLYLEVAERPEGIVAKFIYSTDLFDASTIERLQGHWVTLLQSAIENPTAHLCDLTMMSAAENRQLRFAWNDTHRELPAVTVHRLIEQQAARTPDAIAVEAAGVRLTYRQLNERADRLARRLRNAGVCEGVLVALCIERTVDLLVAPLAVLKAGGAYLPLDPEFPTERLIYLVEDAQAQVVLTTQSLAGRLPPTKARVLFCDAADAQGIGQPLEAKGAAMPESLAYVRYTSGSTGRPKGVEISHRAMVNLLLSMQREPGFTAADSLLAVTTLSFDISELEIYLPLISGGRVVVSTRGDARDPQRLMERLRESKCTVLQATPATWRGLVECGWQGQQNLRAFCGGEALPRDLAEQLLPLVGELWNLYGPTETTVWSAAHRVTSGSGSVPIGRPIDNTEIYVLDAHSNLTPIGVAGELTIGGTGIARGYLRREELTAERFVPHPFETGQCVYRTGDLARWKADGTLECLGRIDNQIKIRGFRIEPGEIEEALLDHEEVRAAAVRVWPDGSGNLSIAAYLAGSATLKPGEMRRFLQQKLPDYMIPARFVMLDALPLTPNGKVDRNALPAPAAAEKTVRSIAARNETERRLVAIWEAVLDARPIGLEENFFDLGGNSSQVAKLLRRIEVDFGVRLSMGAVFESPTISSLAELLRDGPPVARLPRATSLQPVGALEPLLWIYGGPMFRPLARCLGTQRPVLGVDLDGDDEGLAGAPFSEFAARLVRRIRDRQPQGPYHLGGWCTSGLLAYEVASQLIDAGEKVGLVVMLDAPNPAHYFKIPKVRVLRSKAAYHLKRLLRTELGDVLPDAAERLRGLLRQLFDRRPEENPFQNALTAASLIYNPKPISARVLAIQPLDHPEIWNLRESWAPHILQGNFEVRDVPGTHLTMLTEPYVANLATCIKNGLRDNVVEIRRIAAS